MQGDMERGTEAAGGRGMRKPAKMRIAIDTAMAVVLVLVMATALVAEAPHEWLGIALFVLVLAHLVIHRGYFTRLRKGRWAAVRVLALVAIVGVAACLIGQVASAVVLSRHALAFLPVEGGSSWARQVHLLCSHWMFVFAFAHAGLQFRGVVARAPHGRELPASARWAIRIVVAVIAVFGAISFVQLNIAGYLFGQVAFAFADPSVPLALAAARWASIAVLVAVVFHCLALACHTKEAKRR